MACAHSFITVSALTVGMTRRCCRLHATVDEAAALSRPILVDTFPVLYENIAQAISPGYPRESVAEANSVASEHGGEQPLVSNYSHKSVISEYQLLRWTILDVLKKNNVRSTARNST